MVATWSSGTMGADEMPLGVPVPDPPPDRPLVVCDEAATVPPEPVCARM